MSAPNAKSFRPVAVVLLPMLVSLLGLAPRAHAEHGRERSEPYRVLHVMSYHSGWEWNDSQLQGFQDALSGLDVELEVFEMDTKRNSSEDWKQRKGAAARARIDEWQPDLVYTNDDNAQAYVARHFVGSEIPFVFSGVNADPADYGFVSSGNVTGVLEREHSLQTVALLRKLVPDVRRIAVVVDEGPTWPGVIREMQDQLAGESDLDIVEWRVVKTFAEYKSLMRSYQDQVDAVALLGIFTFKDATGRNAAFEDVLQWTAENSALPDFSFWNSRVNYGTLCAVAVSGYAQGYAAGEYARSILVGGKRPQDLPMVSTRKGNPMINLARARDIGIKLNSSTLLAAEVVTDYHWDR